MPGESGKEDMVVGVADGCMFFQRAGQRAVYSSSRFSAAFCKEHVAAHVIKVFLMLSLLCLLLLATATVSVCLSPPQPLSFCPTAENEGLSPRQR